MLKESQLFTRMSILVICLLLWNAWFTTWASSVMANPTYEDFTGWTETDPGGYLSQSPTRATSTDMPRNVDSWLYRNFGTDYFADFVHFFDIQVTSITESDSRTVRCGIYVVSDMAGSEHDLWISGTFILLLIQSSNVANQFLLSVFSNGGWLTADTSIALSTGTTYYIKMERYGANVVVDIYSTPALRDAGGEGNVDRLRMSNAPTTALEYLGATISLGTWYQNSKYISGYIENLDIEPKVRPTISILSPQNITYTTDSIPLIFTVDRPTSWMGYSLDGQANVTISGNTTLTGLFSGEHIIVVYANDTAGSMGASSNVFFAIGPPKLSIELSGEHDYLLSEPVKIRLSALVKNADTGEPCSGANVTLDIYRPDGELMTSASMTERIPQSGVFEWQSEETIKWLRLRKGVYLVHAKASYLEARTSGILEFHIDPPPEEPLQLHLILLFVLATASAIVISVWCIDHLRSSNPRASF